VAAADFVGQVIAWILKGALYLVVALLVIGWIVSLFSNKADAKAEKKRKWSVASATPPVESVTAVGEADGVKLRLRLDGVQDQQAADLVAQQVADAMADNGLSFEGDVVPTGKLGEALAPSPPPEDNTMEHAATTYAALRLLGQV
jgi:hypothetical protein